MIPPTSIDGTDITGATIDGTDVQEITVDGDVVFSAQQLDPSLIVRLRFEQNVNNEISSLTPTDSTSAGYSSDAEEGSFAKDFDGSNDAVIFTDSQFSFSNFYNVPHSVSMQIKTGVTQVLALLGGTFKSSSDDRHRMFVAGDELRFNRLNTNFAATTVVTDNQYHHVVFTYGGTSTGSMNIYVDGSPEASGSRATALSDLNEKFEIGYNQQESRHPYDGLIDDYRIYMKELSSSEVSNLYNTGFTQ